MAAAVRPEAEECAEGVEGEGAVGEVEAVLLPDKAVEEELVVLLLDEEDRVWDFNREGGLEERGVCLGADAVTIAAVLETAAVSIRLSASMIEASVLETAAVAIRLSASMIEASVLEAAAAEAYIAAVNESDV